MNKSTIVLIPARGGSKGIFKKNIKKFNGIPLIEHSINYAKQIPELKNNIYVSTDCKQIGLISKNCGAQIINRPQSISGDEATTESAIEHALKDMPSKPETIILLQATSPLRPKNSLKNALDKFKKNNYDSLLSISPTHHFFWKIKGNNAYPEYNIEKRPRRQDVKSKEISYKENGSLYIFTYKHFLKAKNRLGGNIGYIIFPEQYSLEIDSNHDFKLLETYAKIL